MLPARCAGKTTCLGWIKASFGKGCRVDSEATAVSTVVADAGIGLTGEVRLTSAVRLEAENVEAVRADASSLDAVCFGADGFGVAVD